MIENSRNHAGGDNGGKKRGDLNRSFMDGGETSDSKNKFTSSDFTGKEGIPHKKESKEKVIPSGKDSAPIVLPTELVPTETYPEEQALLPENEREYREITPAENNARFWNMLVSTVAESGYEPPVARQTQVVDIGCSNCCEGKVLNSFLGGTQFEELTDKVHITGIDIYGEGIEDAKFIHRDPNTPGEVLLPNFTFIEGDATNLANLPEVPQEADIVLFRHQEAINDRDNWQEMFGEGLKRVTPSGRIILTSFSEEEHNFALDMFSELPADVVVNKRNPHTFPIDQELGYDKYVAVIKKREERS